jgi:hypothetical protein
MVCVCVPLLLKQNFGVLFGVLEGPLSGVPFFYLVMVLQLYYGHYIYHYISVSPNLIYLFIYSGMQKYNELYINIIPII